MAFARFQDQGLSYAIFITTIRYRLPRFRAYDAQLVTELRLMKRLSLRRNSWSVKLFFRVYGDEGRKRICGYN